VDANESAPLWRHISETVIEVNLSTPSRPGSGVGHGELKFPYPEGWARLERRGDSLFFLDREVVAWRHVLQEKVLYGTPGERLVRIVRDTSRVPIPNRVKTALLENPRLIPEAWLVWRLFFFGAIIEDSSWLRRLEFLRWTLDRETHEHSWVEGHQPIGDLLDEDDRILIFATT